MTNTEAAAAERPRKRRALVCVVCRHEVTDVDAATSVDGRHDHRCINPAGFIYDIGCFARAPGAVASGAPSAYFSWFRGYSWQIVHCRGCDTHLGWRFSREESAFFGLILEALRTVEDADPSQA